jgi:outer membrane scaffolding protein for murein synthesis (MipA/OmpV family)
MNGSASGTAAILSVSLLTFATPATSQEQPEDEQVWSIDLGAGAMYKPDYEGSDDYEIRGVPMFGINYRDIIVLRGPSLMIDAFELTDTDLADSLSFGPIVQFDPGREADDNPILRNLGDIDEGALAGVFIHYEAGPVELGLTVTQDATDRYEGLIAEVEAGYGFLLTQRLRAQFEISGTWADDKYTQAYFGVTPEQSRASGRLRPYTAEAGVKDAGAAVFLHYLVSAHWMVTGRLAYRRLLGDAADSPLVEEEGSRNQASGALFMSYRF